MSAIFLWANKYGRNVFADTMGCFCNNPFSQQVINFGVNDTLFLKSKNYFLWNKLLLRKSSDKFNSIVTYTIKNKRVGSYMLPLGENCFSRPAILSLDKCKYFLTSTSTFKTGAGLLLFISSFPLSSSRLEDVFAGRCISSLKMASYYCGILDPGLNRRVYNF